MKISPKKLADLVRVAKTVTPGAPSSHGGQDEKGAWLSLNEALDDDLIVDDQSRLGRALAKVLAL